MSKKLKIEKIKEEGTEVRVFLNDGSELVGLKKVTTRSSIFSDPTINLEAYVYPETPTVYEHWDTKQRVSLTKDEAGSFFRNRNSFDWRRVHENH